MPPPLAVIKLLATDLQPHRLPVGSKCPRYDASARWLNMEIHACLCINVRIGSILTSACVEAAPCAVGVAAVASTALPDQAPRVHPSLASGPEPVWHLQLA